MARYTSLPLWGFAQTCLFTPCFQIRIEKEIHSEFNGGKKIWRWKWCHITSWMCCKEEPKIILSHISMYKTQPPCLLKKCSTLQQIQSKNSTVSFQTADEAKGLISQQFSPSLKVVKNSTHNSPERKYAPLWEVLTFLWPSFIASCLGQWLAALPLTQCREFTVTVQISSHKRLWDGICVTKSLPISYIDNTHAPVIKRSSMKEMVISQCKPSSSIAGEKNHSTICHREVIKRKSDFRAPFPQYNQQHALQNGAFLHQTHITPFPPLPRYKQKDTSPHKRQVHSDPLYVLIRQSVGTSSFCKHFYRHE